MPRIALSSLLIFMSLCFVLVARATTTNITNSSSGASFLGSSSFSFTLTTADIPAGEVVVDVNFTIDFHKIGGTDCAASVGNAFSSAMSLSLTGPGGLMVPLVTDATTGAASYTNDANAPRVVVRFDDAAAAVVGTTNGGLPESGTFRPQFPLSVFNNINPQGMWTVDISNSLITDPLCYYGFTVQIVTAPPGGYATPTPPVAVSPLCTADGRVNDDRSRDCAAPIAVYCVAGGVHVYGIDPATSRGWMAFYVTAGDIEEAGIPDDANLQLGSLGNIALYRLTDGYFQLNAAYPDGKPYVIAWDGCPMTSVVTLDG